MTLTYLIEGSSSKEGRVTSSVHTRGYVHFTIDKLFAHVKNDLKCQRHLVEAGAVSLNHINCEPNTSLIHHQSEKNDSLSWKILILDVVGVVAGGDEKIFFAAKYKTGLDDKVRLSVSSVTGVGSYVVVHAAVMKEEHTTCVIS